MRIDGWSIAGFGRLESWQVDGLAEHDLIVVLGPNESGKSTLRAFIETSLYGFAPATREQNQYTPDDDGPFGGSLQLVAVNDDRFTVTRHLKATPRGRVDRAPGHDELGNRALPETGAISRAMFADLHQITIDHLLALNDATWRTVEERLLTGSGLAFLRSAVEARSQIEERSNAIWRPDRRGNTAVRALDERIRELHEVERAGSAVSRRQLEVVRELAELAGLEATAREARARLTVRRELHDRHGPASAAIDEIASARAAAAELLPVDDLPVDPEGTLERCAATVARGARIAGSTSAERDQLARCAGEVLDEVVLERAAAIDELAATSALDVDLARRERGAVEAVAIRAAERARLALIVLERDVEPDDVAAFERVAPARVRAAIARRERAGRPSPLRRLALVAGALAAAFLALAAVSTAGRLVPVLAALALGAVALALAAPRARREADAADGDLDDALAGLRISPARRALPDTGLIGELDALVAAHAAFVAASRQLETEQVAHAARSARRERVLASVGAADVAAAVRRLAAARERATTVAAARSSLVGATGRAEEAAGDLASARAEHAEVLARIVAIDRDPTRALQRVTEARRLRAVADERERTTRATFGDLTEIERAVRAGEVVVMTPVALEAFAIEEQERAYELEDLRHRRGALEAERAALAAAGVDVDPAGEIAACRERRDQLMRERDRLALVAATIAAAERRFRERHGPAFLAAAGRHLARITDGRYAAVHLASDLPDGGVQRLELVRHDGERCLVASPLSRGTIEQVFLSLRLALLDELDQTSRLPLYLDEALVNWDDGRSDGLIGILGSLAGRQALVGTCHRELAERLEAIGAVVVSTPARSAPRNPRIGSV